MTIIHTFDNIGGFVVGDTDTGITSYACPSSTYARQARTNGARYAIKVAHSMIQSEPEFPRYQERDAANWQRLGRNPDAPECIATP